MHVRPRIVYKYKSVSTQTDFNRVLDTIKNNHIYLPKPSMLNDPMEANAVEIRLKSMLILLDQAGICGSSGSACTSGSLDPSHVLLAIGLPHEIAHGSLRLTLSEKTTLEDIDYTVDKLKEIIARLRSMSPLYEDFVKKNGKSEA